MERTKKEGKRKNTKLSFTNKSKFQIINNLSKKKKLVSSFNIVTIKNDSVIGCIN